MLGIKFKEGQEHRRSAVNVHKVPIQSLETGDYFAIVVAKDAYGTHMEFFMVVDVIDPEAPDADLVWSDSLVEPSPVKTFGKFKKPYKQTWVVTRNMDSLYPRIFKTNRRVRLYSPTETEKLLIIPYF